MRADSGHEVITFVSSLRRLLLLMGCLCFSLHPFPSMAREEIAGQTENLERLKRCMYGGVSDEDAEEIGKFLGRNYHSLEFDAAIFSGSCEDKILVGLFGKYDETTSINLTRFFWDDEFLIRHLKVSLLRNLECDLSCLLRADKRPLKSFGVFREVLKSMDKLKEPALDFLLARTLISNQASKDELYGEVVEHIVEGDRRKNVVQLLLILGAPRFLRNAFSVGKEYICLGNYCLRYKEANPPKDCEEMAAQSSLQDLVGLKLWAITAGGNFFRDCLETQLKKETFGKKRDYVEFYMALNFFEPRLTANDVMNGYAEGVFKKFDFLEEDVSSLANLNIGSLRSVTSLFAESIVTQVEEHPEYFSVFQEPSARNATILVGSTLSGARFEYFLCSHGQVSDPGARCRKQDVYVSKFKRTMEK